MYREDINRMELCACAAAGFLFSLKQGRPNLPNHSSSSWGGTEGVCEEGSRERGLKGNFLLRAAVLAMLVAVKSG